MGYKRFEELPVWKDAIELAVRALAFTATGCLRACAGLKDQFDRAAVSISNNIAEGFERGTNSELLTFLYIARGSAGEVRSMLHLIDRLQGGASSPAEIDELRARAEDISRQLGRWIESIKDSGFEGTRSRNAQTRQAEQVARRRQEFLGELKRLQDEGRT